MTKQRNVLITGASSGIGRASAIELAERGHRVIASARRLPQLEEVEREHPGITALPLDVTDAGQIEAAVAQVDGLTDGHGIDVLVNNAGFALTGPVEALSGAAVEHQFATNVFGLLNVTRAFLPRMRQHRSGTIVNISSVVGRVVFPGMGVYSATKFAVEALSDALRMELAPFGVSVVLIEPAFVKTDLGATSVREAAPFTLAANGYQELMEKTGTFLAREIGENAIPAGKVARQIADAVESRKPKARYALPLSGRAVIKLFGALPPASADRAKLRRLGVGRASS